MVFETWLVVLKSWPLRLAAFDKITMKNTAGSPLQSFPRVKLSSVTCGPNCFAARLTADWNWGCWTNAAEAQKSIEAACAKLGFQSRRLPSGAGHDARMMVTLGPMGMLFVPGVGGISHSLREFARWEDCPRGADVLLETVLGWAA